MFELVIVTLVTLGAFGYLMARQRAAAMAAAAGVHSHSLPSYHGTFVALWVGLPALFLSLIWLLLQDTVIDRLILASLPQHLTEGLDAARESLVLSEIRSIAGGQVFGQPDPEFVAAAGRLNAWSHLAGWAMVATCAALALLALVVTRRKIRPAFRARHGVERILDGLMIACAVVAIVTTLGIVVSLLFEAFRFFERVPLGEFLFGLNWEPQIAIRADQVAGQGAFGAVPVFLGTLVIAFIAMAFAVPIGLLAAIYLAEYANSRFRTSVKPILEILAGIPTVVYGFFAVLTVAPAARAFGAAIGLDVAPNSALVAGGVMGIMIIPFISSLSDDALNAVPRSLRDGSYAMGAT
ncbi:MAG: phosphate ABC transporter permease family protein, partial [Bacteroidota bacterium]|nr:phosphate ABC transporter permease family protein [Kiloniellaceae bacterium]